MSNPGCNFSTQPHPFWAGASALTALLWLDPSVPDPWRPGLAPEISLVSQCSTTRTILLDKKPCSDRDINQNASVCHLPSRDPGHPCGAHRVLEAPWTTGQAPRLIHALFHTVALLGLPLPLTCGQVLTRCHPLTFCVSPWGPHPQGFLLHRGHMGIHTQWALPNALHLVTGISKPPHSLSFF